MIHPTQAQAAADAIKQRRKVVSELRFLAELVEDGLPAPLAVHPSRTGRTRIQVWAHDLPEWLLFFDEPLPEWTSHHNSPDGQHAEVDVDHGLTLTAFRRATTEVTC